MRKRCKLENFVLNKRKREFKRMSVISSHVMFIDSRASAGRRDSVLVNCMTGAPVGCQIRVSMLEFSAPAGSFGTENTVYLRMLGASLSARESEGLSLPPGQQKNEDHLNPSSILAKIPVLEGKAVQFQSPFLLFGSTGEIVLLAVSNPIPSLRFLLQRMKQQSSSF